MSEQTDFQVITTYTLLNLFESASDSHSAATASNYRKAVASLRAYLATRPDISGVPHPSDIADWHVTLSLHGQSSKTLRYYLESLSSLYNTLQADNATLPDNPFRPLLAHLKQLPAADGSLLASAADSLAKLTHASHLLKGEASIATDITLFLLTLNLPDIDSVARMQRGDIDSLPPQLQEAAHRHTDNRRRYIFPLDQSGFTPRQLRTFIQEMVLSQLKRHGVATFGTLDETMAIYWALGALRSGITPTLIANLLISRLGRIPAPLSPFNAILPADPALFTSDLPHITYYLSPLPRWYAMRLRPGVRYSDLEERLSPDRQPSRYRIPGTPSAVELFYPCDEITRRIGKKLIHRQKPFISDILFFRIRTADIYPLFRQIGDLAWCYTTTGAPGGTYASIPAASMERFQQAIGCFTPDFEVSEIGGITPNPGDRVVILGGLFSGLEADIEKVIAPDTIYRVIFPDHRGIEWRLDLDRRQLRLLS